MLRALGAQIEKTTNREACRDLSGRRLRDVNHEKAMAEWVKQQAEREAEKEQKRLERLQRKLAEAGRCFASPDYQQQCHEMAERLEDSVLKGMQAASSKMVLAEIGEKRKQPHKSETDGGASARKRKCFWLDMQGLETAQGSSSGSSDDDSEEAPSTSGVSFQLPKHSSGGVETAPELPHASQRTGVLTPDSRSPEKRQGLVPDSGNGVVGEQYAELGEPAAPEHAAVKVARGPERDREARSAGPASAGRDAAAALTKEKETEAPEGDRAARGAPGADREAAPPARPEQGQPEGQPEGPAGAAGTGRAAVDLLAFSSAAEMESLGLEKLKCELLALGLKCGGTLQERAARLFAVRGLTREQMDPALFARPVKGKKAAPAGRTPGLSAARP
ncbi:PREDICTED: protein SDE2 homolog isoform X2 [Condylura cristata]|nr:PREDICTED: protein SDE2 homolog isoform X2 [Condylura cristata]XP_012586422.1 PREDICTED: protein SDE2 homolog isoform X2 [Condylura cristata]